MNVQIPGGQSLLNVARAEAIRSGPILELLASHDTRIGGISAAGKMV